eukprot:TRINITY_DN32984_c0_g1_i1.p1 TRINITY_DN32984_c0_g1~~TRINITY_DN32984_c0_g1_i1.p1  ORF type:complete len:919 (-),score=150.03 TRINITY_DN32984_c0_g1_i1:71-2806(-)
MPVFRVAIIAVSRDSQDKGGIKGTSSPTSKGFVRKDTPFGGLSGLFESDDILSSSSSSEEDDGGRQRERWNGTQRGSVTDEHEEVVPAQYDSDSDSSTLSDNTVSWAIGLSMEEMHSLTKKKLRLLKRVLRARARCRALDDLGVPPSSEYYSSDPFAFRRCCRCPHRLKMFEVRAPKFMTCRKRSSEAVRRFGQSVRTDKLGEPSAKVRWLMRLGLVNLAVEVDVQRATNAATPPTNRWSHRKVTSLTFEIFSALTIISSLLFLGAQSSYGSDATVPLIFTVMENIFTALFVLEIRLRISAFSFIWIFDKMNFFDVAITLVTSVVPTWILAPMGASSDTLQRLSAIRAFRVIRLVRKLRLFSFFYELWVILLGILSSGSMLMWSFAFIGLINYIFSVSAKELFLTSPLFAENSIVQEQFNGMFQSMFTFFQILTFRGAFKIVRPITYRMPEAFILFALFFGVGGILLVNLITAVVVQRAFEAKQTDTELTEAVDTKNRICLLRQLDGLFSKLDKSRDGTLSKDEFLAAVEDKDFARQCVILDINLSELTDVFDVMDDGDGQVTFKEFTTGILKMSDRAVRADVLMATKRMRQANARSQKTVDPLAASDKSREATEKTFDGVHKTLSAIQLLVRDLLEGLDTTHQRALIKLTTKLAPPPPQLPEVDELLEEEAKGAQTRIVNPSTSVNLRPLPQSWIHLHLEDKKDKMLAAARSISKTVLEDAGRERLRDDEQLPPQNVHDPSPKPLARLEQAPASPPVPPLPHTPELPEGVPPALLTKETLVPARPPWKRHVRPLAPRLGEKEEFVLYGRKPKPNVIDDGESDASDGNIRGHFRHSGSPQGGGRDGGLEGGHVGRAHCGSQFRKRRRARVNELDYLAKSKGLAERRCDQGPEDSRYDQIRAKAQLPGAAES